MTAWTIPAAFAASHQLDAFGGVHRQRFLADDVLAGGDRLQGHRLVQVVGRGDMDGVELWIGQQLLEGIERARQPHCFGAGGAVFWRGTENAYDLDPDPAQRFHMHRTDESGPYDRCLACLRHRILLSVDAARGVGAFGI